MRKQRRACLPELTTNRALERSLRHLGQERRAMGEALREHLVGICHPRTATDGSRLPHYLRQLHLPDWPDKGTCDMCDLPTRIHLSNLAVPRLVLRRDA